MPPLKRETIKAIEMTTNIHQYSNGKYHYAYEINFGSPDVDDNQNCGGSSEYDTLTETKAALLNAIISELKTILK